jgi:hypothetical protein
VASADLIIGRADILSADAGADRRVPAGTLLMRAPVAHLAVVFLRRLSPTARLTRDESGA